MNEENTIKYNWIMLGIVGLFVILSGTILKNHIIPIPISKDLSLVIGDIIYGIGVSFFTAMVIKLGITLFEGKLQKHWRGNFIEIFGTKRIDCRQRYAKEDKELRKGEDLYIISFTAENVLNQLERKSGEIYEALTERQVKLKILIVNPACQVAEDKAINDFNVSGKYEDGLKIFMKFFIKWGCIYEEMERKREMGNNFGSLIVGILEEHPLLTITGYGDRLIIFGPYFTKNRGDEYSAMKVENKWHPEIFKQYKTQFDNLWQNANILMKIDRENPQFNNILFNNIKEKRKKYIENSRSGS